MIFLCAMHVNNFSFLGAHTYVKTKKREVEPTRRQAAVHTGMKALGFSESAPLAGILSSPHSSHSHTTAEATPPAQVPVSLLGHGSSSGSERRRTKTIVQKKKKEEKERKKEENVEARAEKNSGAAQSRIPCCGPSVPAGSGAQMPPLVYPKGGAFTHGSRGALLHYTETSCCG